MARKTWSALAPGPETPPPTEAPRRLVNSYDQIKAAGGDGFVISPIVGPTTSRAERQSYTAWAVHRVVRGQTVDTDTNAAWYYHGQKVFLFHFHGGKKTSLELAQAWVKKQFGFAGPWARNAVFDYVPKAINDKFPIPKRETT